MACRFLCKHGPWLALVGLAACSPDNDDSLTEPGGSPGNAVSSPPTSSAVMPNPPTSSAEMAAEMAAAGPLTAMELENDVTTVNPVDGDPPNADMAVGDQPGLGDRPDASVEPPPPVVTACDTEEEERFSFFMVSYEAIRREAGSDDGFGGDLGGIAGADDICSRVALTSSDCAGNRTWRAFLSTTGEDAIDRIGSGPWHDRLGRLLANDVSELLNERPPNADPEIINDFPNEFGIPNHNPDGTGLVDNHQTLTGSGLDGRLYTQEPADEPGGSRGGGGFGGPTACMDGEWTPEKATCWDWTVSEPVGCPRVGHSWPRRGSGIHWISVWNEGGCAPGVVLDDFTPPGGPTVGSFGGYGGFYCFAMTP